MGDGSGLAEALLVLDGFRVLEVSETPEELMISIETTVEVVGCGSCGTRAESQDRMSVELRDLACFGRPARLVWRKRRWRSVISISPTSPPRPPRSWTRPSPAARPMTSRRSGLSAGPWRRNPW